MIYFQFLIGLLIYLGMAYMSYYEPIKNSKWYFVIGLLGANLANYIWLCIAKFEVDSHKLVIKGLYWDTMLMACYLLIPILFFEAKFTNIQAVGVFLIISGLILTKV